MLLTETIQALNSSEGSLCRSVGRSFTPVFFCVPGPGLLTLAGPCVVLPEGTVPGSTMPATVEEGSGIKGALCVGVKRFIFIFSFYRFIYEHNLKCATQRHQQIHTVHVCASRNSEWGDCSSPFFLLLIVSIILQIKPFLLQLCNYFFLQILKWKPS